MQDIVRAPPLCLSVPCSNQLPVQRGQSLSAKEKNCALFSALFQATKACFRVVCNPFGLKVVLWRGAFACMGG
jgi:hypothetical protein